MFTSKWANLLPLWSEDWDPPSGTNCAPAWALSDLVDNFDWFLEICSDGTTANSNELPWMSFPWCIAHAFVLAGWYNCSCTDHFVTDESCNCSLLCSYSESTQPWCWETLWPTSHLYDNCCMQINSLQSWKKVYGRNLIISSGQWLLQMELEINIMQLPNF